MTNPITVVGGGLAGAMLATYLGREGFAVSLFDSRPDLRTTDISAGRSINLALATRGIVALEELGLMNRVTPLLTPMRGRMIHDRDGTQTLQMYGNRTDEVIYSVGRSDLTAILLDAAEDTGNVVAHFQHRCVGGSALGGVLQFVNYATDEQFDVETVTFFGTDGWASVVRDILVAEGDTTVTTHPLDHGYKELQLPPGPDGAPLLDPNALHIWPRGGFMLIALANIDHSFTCTLFVPRKGAEFSLETLDDADTVKRFFRREFPDFVALDDSWIQQMLTNPDGHVGTIHVDGWALQDKAVILGDAAHAIVPFHGQGMNAAFESCRVLMESLRRHPHNWEAAFVEFEAARKPDTDAIAQMALDNYLEMRSSVRDDRYVLRRQLALELERRWPEQFVPRYSMVMFRTLPYAEAQRRAAVQAEILRELTEGVDSLEQVDFAKAAQLVERLPR